MKVDRTPFNEMLEMAELAANGHRERRQLEFRISISYVTLLSLALYQLIKLTPGETGFIDVSWWMIILLCVVLSFLHWIYLDWLNTLHIASNNDVRRRDFYLKKAEVIAYYRSKSSDSDFVPSSTQTVTYNLGAGNSRKVSESELFDQTEPDIYIRSRRQGTPPPKFCRNVHFLFPASFATLMAVSLIVALILKTGLGNAIKSFVLWVLL